MLPPTVTEFAPAKVNLTLHVTGQRADGYHLLDSLVVFCGIGDWVRVDAAPALGLSITGPQAQFLAVGDDNLVLRAARAMDATRGAALRLDKHLPLASGIGGGSSDAAATLRALARLWDKPLPDHATLLSLGADVPVCLLAQPARMSGIGDRVVPVSGLPDLHIMLVNPGIAMPTPAMFGALRTKRNPPMQDTLPTFSNAKDFAAWLTMQRNDLEGPARAQAPVIDTVLAEISANPCALLARMSGSGATCFGLFADADAANAACRTVGQTHPDWWVAAGPVLGH